MKRFAILLALVLGAGAAPASAAIGGWTIQPAPAPAALNSDFNSVSCGSPTSCVAVGSYVAPDGSARPFANVGDGTNWAASYPVSPASDQPESELNDVSCVSASYCVAVGAYGHGNGPATRRRSIVESFDGNTWRQETDALRSSVLVAVSCPVATFCVAVAGDQPPSSIETRGADGRWTTALTTPTGVRLFDVSCRSATSCVAVGASYRTNRPFAAVFDGTSWTVSQPSSRHGAVDLESVSCLPDGCTAVGSSQNGAAPLVETWNGTTWMQIANPVPATGGRLTTVSCAAANDCVAIGIGPAATENELFTDVWDGTSWTLRAGPQPDPTRHDTFETPAMGVDCPSTLRCVYATDAGSFAPSSHGYLSLRQSGRWTQVDAAEAPGTAQTDLAGVSCAGSTCFAVGTFSGLAVKPVIATRHASSWQVSLLPLPAGARSGELSSVSCVTASFCVAVGSVDTAPASFVWSGTSWQYVDVPLRAGYSGGFGAVSCVSSTMCLATGSQYSGTVSRQLVARFSGSAWTEVAPPYGAAAANQHPLTAVSCATTRMCVAVGLDFTGRERGYGARWNGSTWKVEQLPGMGEAASVSCSSTTWCVAAGDDLTYGAPALARFNGTDWAAQTPGRSSGFLASVSCVTATFCAAVGSDTETNANETNIPVGEIWDGSVWRDTSVPSPVPGQDAYLSAVSCPSVAACSAAGDARVATTLPLLVAYPA